MFRKIPGGGVSSSRLSRWLLASVLAVVAVAVGIIGFCDVALAASSSSSDNSDDDNLTFSIPTSIPFALKADGSCVSPSDWAISVFGSSKARIVGFKVSGLPSGVTLSGESGECSTFYDKGSGKFSLSLDGSGSRAVSASIGSDDDPLCFGGGLSVSWALGGVDGNRSVLDGAAAGRLVLGTVSVDVRAVAAQSFAIISDDGQMRFYHRVRVPAIGESYDSVTVKHVYAGLDNACYGKTTEDWFGECNTPWYGERDEPKSVVVVDDGIVFSTVSYLFHGLLNVTSIDLEKLNIPSSYNNDGLFHLFDGCTSLVSIKWPSEWENGGYKILTLDNTFANCSSLASIDLSWADLSSCNNICGTFMNCTSLKSIEAIENICPSSVYRMEYCFLNCSSLEMLDLSGWDTSGALAYDKQQHCSVYSFLMGCSRLRVLKLGAKFVWGDIHNHKQANDLFPPSPSSSFVDGADGFWYAASDGAKYASDKIPSGVADTYYAVRPMAFAVYSSDDGSLDFYNRAGRPVVGDEWGGKRVDGVYSGFEDKRYRTTSPTNNDLDTMTTPWADVHNNVLSVSVIDDGIKPVSIAFWFQFFKNCISFDLDKLDMSNCDSLQHTFAYCYNAIDMQVGQWDVSKATNFDSTFKYMHALSSIDLSGWSTSAADNMHEMFMNDYKLAEAKLGDKWNTAKVTDFVEMFMACHPLVLDCSDWDVSSTNYNEFTNPAVASGTIGNSRFCDGAPGVIKPRPWQVTAFAVFCSNDGSLDFYKRERRLAPLPGSLFEGREVSSIYTGFEDEFYKQVPSEPSYETTSPWNGIRKEVKSVSVVDNGIRPLSISLWFSGFSSMLSVDMAKLDLSRCVNAYATYYACTNLKSIDMSGTDLSSCLTFESMFNGCINVKNIDISNWKLSKSGDVTMKNMFIACHRLTDIAGIDVLALKNVTNMDSMFSDCPALSINLSDWDVAKSASHGGFNRGSAGVIMPKVWKN